MRSPVAVFLLVATTAFGQAPCDCIDKGDLKERAKLAQAAIEAYAKEMMPPGGLRPYTTKLRKELQGRVGAAMANARTPGRILPFAKAETSNVCTVDVDPRTATKCLEAVVRAHEQVHVNACKATFTRHTPIILAKGVDRYEALGMVMTEYMMEEIQGYQTELTFIAKELARLEKDCKPPPPPPERDYSSNSHSPIDVDGPSPRSNPPETQKPRPYGAPPLAKPKPLEKPKPLPTPSK